MYRTPIEACCHVDANSFQTMDGYGWMMDWGTVPSGNLT